MTFFYRGAGLFSRTGHCVIGTGFVFEAAKRFLIQVGRWFVQGHRFQIRLSAPMHCIPSSPESDAEASTRVTVKSIRLSFFWLVVCDDRWP